MLNLVSIHSASAAAPQPAICPKPPAGEPAPAPPTESVDLSNIDTAAKAATLPIMDAAVQLGVAAGITAAIMAGMGGGSAPLISLDIASKTAGQESNINISMDAKNEESPITSSGSFAGQPVSGGIVIDEQAEKISWVGKIGENAEELHFAGLDENEQSLKLNVKFGSVEGDLKFSPIVGDAGPDDYKGYRLAGTLGGQEYQVDTILNIPEELKNGQPPEDGKISTTMTSTGHVGGQEIKRDYTLDAVMTSSGIIVDVNGTGTTAGIPQELKATLTVAP